MSDDPPVRALRLDGSEHEGRILPGQVHTWRCRATKQADYVFRSTSRAILNLELSDKNGKVINEAKA